jgi:peptidoglycan hydrolase-like protein with peptidoglycan-binding domain
MRFWVLALSLLGFLLSADATKAGLSSTTRDVSTAIDPATSADEATQATEDQIGLDKGKRRAVQRRLTRLGFDTKVNGKFDESTRAVITRWQAARGYPGTGFLNTLQHKALLTESVSAAQASTGDEADNDRPARRRGGGAQRHRSGGGGPLGVIGGVMGGLLGRR